MLYFSNNGTSKEQFSGDCSVFDDVGYFFSLFWRDYDTSEELSADASLYSFTYYILAIREWT